MAANNVTEWCSGYLPNNSSVQIKVSVLAPTILGGIATSISVFAPPGQDININNNQSIISMWSIFTIDFQLSTFSSDTATRNRSRLG
jgi:hypothetical protein